MQTPPNVQQDFKDSKQKKGNHKGSDFLVQGFLGNLCFMVDTTVINYRDVQFFKSKIWKPKQSFP